VITRRLLRNYFGMGPYNLRLGATCTKAAMTIGREKVSPNIISSMPTWPACFHQPCPTKTSLAL
jgi:hypothetical protein